MTVTIVDGDLLDHPEFHADYDAFVALHYDANIYGSGGTFWGRATASVTGALDDALGAALWTKLRAIPQAPAAHFERLNVNVTDYYGFRLTSAKTPGVLIELGVGAPGAPDYLWLRTYQQNIADAIAIGLSTFAGGGHVSTPVYAGQSVGYVNIKVGEVAQINGIWTYAGKGNRIIAAKVYGTGPGIFPVSLYPPVDPDSDPTLVLNTQPALFIVAVRPQ